MIYLLNREPDFNYDRNKSKYYISIKLKSIDDDYIELDLNNGDNLIFKYKGMPYLKRHIELGSEWSKRYMTNILVNLYGRDVEIILIKEKDGSDAFDNIFGYMWARGTLGRTNRMLVNLLDRWEQDKNAN